MLDALKFPTSGLRKTPGEGRIQRCMQKIFPGHVEAEKARRQGFTLIEVMIAMTILVVALLGAIGTITAIGALGESNRESTAAYQEARAVIERLGGVNFDELFATYNLDPNDDPDGAGTADGQNFDVPELDTRVGDPDGFVGQILLPISPGGALREDLVDPSFGMPRDLNGDGIVDAADHADDYILLPVRVRLEWTGKSGQRFVEYASMLGRRD